MEELSVSNNGNNGALPLLCSFIKKESTIEDDKSGSVQSIDSYGITSLGLTKDYIKSECNFKCETVIETDDVIHNLDFESAKKLLRRNWKDATTDQSPISVKMEDIANLNDDFNRGPNRAIDMIPQPRIHTDTSDFCSTNGNSSSLNDDQSMEILEKQSGLHTVNSKSPILIKEELIEVDEYTDDTNNHMSSNIALQIKMEWEDTSDSETHSETNQSEPSSCENENNLPTVTTISTICKEELDLDVRSVMVKEESHNVDEIDIKLEASMRGNITKYSKSQNDNKNCDSTSSDKEKQQYMCHACPQKFPTRRSLIDHLISHHAKYVVYKCRTCDTPFITKAAFSEHSADCQAVKEPNRTLVTIKSMSHRMVKVNNTKVPLQTLVYWCSICTKVFNAEISLRNHFEESLSCEKCLKLFCSSIELQIHNKVHDNEILFECPTCTKKFKYKRTFTFHTNSKVTCEKCTASFCQNSDLQIHKQTCKCPHKKSVGVKKAVSRSDNRNLRKFDCTICQSKFDCEKKLKIHISNKQETCNVCGEKYCKNNLFEHETRFGHWPFPSGKLCSEKFDSPKQLMDHVPEHYSYIISCGRCPRKFLTSLDLLNHNKTDHKDPPPKSSSSEIDFATMGASN